MGFNKNLKKAMFWLRRKSHLPMLIVVAISVVMLVFNDDTSIAVSKNTKMKSTSCRSRSASLLTVRSITGKSAKR